MTTDQDLGQLNPLESGEGLGATTVDVQQVLKTTEAVEQIFEGLPLNENQIATMSEDQRKETRLALENEAQAATIVALTKAGVPVAAMVPIPQETQAPQTPQERQAKSNSILNMRLAGIFTAMTEKITAKAITDIDGSQSDEAVEKQMNAQIDQVSAGAYDFLKMASNVAEYIGSFIPGRSAKSESEDTFKKEYKSIMVELAKRLNYVKKRLKYLGGGAITSELKIAMSFTTLIPFALLGELRSNFELAHKVLWWLKRTSRIYVEDRHGGIGEREPQDQSLRNEASSFPLAAEVPQTDVASILTKKLERYAQNQKEYFLNDGKAHVLVWNKNAPAYIDVPLEWFVGPTALPLSEAKARVQALLQEVVQNTQSVEMSSANMNWLRQKAYGNYDQQGEAMKKVFDADISIVLDNIDVHDPKAVMNHSSFLTAGARVRETLIFQHESGSDDPLHGVNGVVNKFAHTHVDGKTARELMIRDLQGVAELAQSDAGGEGLQINLKSMIRSIDADISQQIANEAESETASSEQILKGERYGVAKVDRQRSEIWIRRIGALREWFKGLESNNPVSFGTADIFCVAQMLASRTQSVHFLESRMAMLPVKDADDKESEKSVEVLDVAFNIIPEEYLDVFTKLMAEISRSSTLPPEFQVAEAWERMNLPPEKVAELRKNFIEGMRQFIEEKKRAKQSDSMASFMSTLAGGIKQVEKLMQFVSQSGVSVGEVLTQAVGNPRGGMVSMLAETRSLPQRNENGINMLWFGSANTDIFFGDSLENWGGVLGVSSSSEGFSFFLRKLLKQSKVSTEYYAQNKAFQEELKKPGLARVPKIQGMALVDLPELLAVYENTPLIQRQDVFGPGLNHVLVYQELKSQAAKFLPKIESSSEEDAQRQAEDVVFAVEFIIHLLSSDPAYLATL